MKRDVTDYALQLSMNSLLVSDLQHKLHNVNGRIPYVALGSTLWNQRQELIESIDKQSDIVYECLTDYFKMELPHELKTMIAEYDLECEIMELSHLIGNITLPDKTLTEIKSKLRGARTILNRMKRKQSDKVIKLDDIHKTIQSLLEELSLVPPDTVDRSYYNNSKHSSKVTMNQMIDLKSKHIHAIVEYTIGKHIIPTV